MKSAILKIALATAATAALASATPGTAYASGGVSPANTPVTATSTNIKFSGVLNGLSFTVTCTNSVIKAVTPATGYGPVPISPDPTFSSCTDNLGGTDTVSTNHNNGSWQLTAIPSPTGLKITVPTAGVTLTTTYLPGCVVTGAPNGPANMTASYDNAGTATLSNVSLPTSGNFACGIVSNNATVNGKYTLSPVITIT
jgi:hypothetical protein